MLEYGVIYAAANGQYMSDISGPPGTIAATANNLLPDRRITQVPQAAIIAPAALGDPVTIDLGLLKAQAASNVGDSAETVRQRFISPGSGKAMSYQQKAAEARAYSGNTSAPTPILSAEASVRGITVAALVTEVLGVLAVWTAAEVKINAAEMGAKVAIYTATNIKQIVDAAVVNWDAALAA